MAYKIALYDMMRQGMEWEQNRAAQRNQPHNGSSAPQPLFPTIRRTPFQNRRSSKRRTVKGKSCVMCFKVMIPQGTITESCQYIVVMVLVNVMNIVMVVTVMVMVLAAVLVLVLNLVEAVRT